MPVDDRVLYEQGIIEQHPKEVCPFCGEDILVVVDDPVWNHEEKRYEEILTCMYCGNRIMYTLKVDKIFKLIPQEIKQPDISSEEEEVSQ